MEELDTSSSLPVILPIRRLLEIRRPCLLTLFDFERNWLFLGNCLAKGLGRLLLLGSVFTDSFVHLAASINLEKQRNERFTKKTRYSLTSHADKRQAWFLNQRVTTIQCLLMEPLVRKVHILAWDFLVQPTFGQREFRLRDKRTSY